MKSKEQTTKTVTRMKRNAKACNRHLTDEFLNSRTPAQLLNFVHPLDRVDFASAIGVKIEAPKQEEL